MELALLLLTILALAAAAFIGRKLRPRSQKILVGVVLICAVAFLCAGQAAYDHNTAMFHKSLGGDAVEFKGLNNAANYVKLNDGSLKFRVGEDGKAHPDTIWKLGQNYFYCSILCFSVGLAMIVRLLI